jgi:hypothetical protein
MTARVYVNLPEGRLPATESEISLGNTFNPSFGRELAI